MKNFNLCPNSFVPATSGLVASEVGHAAEDVTADLIDNCQVSQECAPRGQNVCARGSNGQSRAPTAFLSKFI